MVIVRRRKKEYKKEDIILYHNQIRKMGIKAYDVRSVARSVCGVGCVVVGVVTSFIPFSSIPLYIVGGGLLGIDVISLYYKVKGVVRYEVKVWVLSATAQFKAGYIELLRRRFKK